MKLRSLLVSTFVLVALIGTLYWSEHRKPVEAKASAGTAPSILKLDEGSITRLALKARSAEPIVLEKQSSNWQITEPKHLGVDQTAVSGVLSTLSSLNSERVIQDKTSDLKPYGLVQPAVEADITEKDNKTQQLLLGDDTPAGNAVYAMLAGDPRVFTIASYQKTSIDKNLNDLRDKRLLTVSADKVSRLDLTGKNQEIEFGRNKDEWQILKPRPLRADSLQVGDLVSKLADARMDLTASSGTRPNNNSGSSNTSQETASAFAYGTPVATAKVTDPAGTQEIEVRKNKDTYYAKSSVVEGVYKVDASLGHALDKKLDDFRNKKIFDFGFEEPTKIEIHDGASAYFLSRGGADWWQNGKKMDAESVQTLISDLRDLAATKFAESGFAGPTLQLSVTSADGKKVENVSIAKSGDGFLARRDNDSTFYYLESSPVTALQKAAAGLKPAASNSR